MSEDLRFEIASQPPACDQNDRHKVIDLEADEVFKRTVELDEEVFCPVPGQALPITQKTRDDAFDVMETLLDLVTAGKLDKTDLKIIKMRNCSPMPSMRAIARELNLSPDTVSQRIGHIKALIPKELHPKM